MLSSRRRQGGRAGRRLRRPNQVEMTVSVYGGNVRSRGHSASGDRAGHAPMASREEERMIIDSHCHAWTTWPYDATVPDPDSRGRIEQLLFEMDRNGVDRADPHLRPHRLQPGQQRVRRRGGDPPPGPDRPVPGRRLLVVAGVPHAGCRGPAARRRRPLGDRRVHPLRRRGERRLARRRGGRRVLRPRRRART